MRRCSRRVEVDIWQLQWRQKSKRGFASADVVFELRLLLMVWWLWFSKKLGHSGVAAFAPIASVSANVSLSLVPQTQELYFVTLDCTEMNFPMPSPSRLGRPNLSTKVAGSAKIFC